MDDTTGRVRRADDLAGRGTETTRGYATGERDEQPDARTREIRHEIEETRDEMTETIDAIQEKLKPRNIVANATDRVKSAASERVREMTDTASHTAQQAIDYTRERATEVAGSARQNSIPLALIGLGAAWLLASRSRESSERRTANRRYGYGGSVDADTRSEWWDDDRDTGVMGRIRNNPVPAALAGIGLGWLAFGGNERNDDYYRYDRTGTNWREQDELDTGRDETASRTGDYALNRAGSTRSMGRMVRRRQNQVRNMLQENPLLVGAGALMLGAAFGMAVPETEAENEWMGEARDNMVGRARGMAADAASQVQEVAGSVADAAQKLTGKTQS